MAVEMVKTLRLFHHTTKYGAKGILKSGCIKASPVKKIDAVYGVYMTRLGPEKNQEEIAWNNYNDKPIGIANKMLKAGKTDAIIAIDIPKRQCNKIESDRDIYVVSGNVTIADKNPKIYFRDKDGKAEEYKPS
ncbi:uncharacterized protein LOC110454948 [Mizuhopecten yessoensis]|uniref:uncharacterized protein LOC110454948 n=1 Tax=Mizuhopecten yessoensis TaxID=6573 RepID=UPI000B45ADD4|nr:uncharacterized protein LOC110454948 [Mizuhopecten yessoensis]